MFIAMTALGLLLYIAFFVHVERYSENLAFLVVLLIPLVPVFYLGIGFIIGLFGRIVRGLKVP